MTDPTPLEIAAALRSAAEFCRGPEDLKCHGTEAKNARGDDCSPLSPQAKTVCAIGFIRRRLHIVARPDRESLFVATELVGMRGQACDLFMAFDKGWYETAASMLDERAAELEASIPTHPATQREAVQS